MGSVTLPLSSTVWVDSILLQLAPVSEQADFSNVHIELYFSCEFFKELSNTRIHLKDQFAYENHSRFYIPELCIYSVANTFTFEIF